MRFSSIAFFCCLALPVQGQERAPSPERAKGYQSVITQCVSFTRASFANAACDDLLTRIDPLIRAEGLTHVALGRTEWGFGSDVYLTPSTTPPDAVHLTLYLRGADSPPVMSLTLSLYKQTPNGRLVLWEDSGLGSGEKAFIANGLSQVLAQKLVPIIETLGQNKKP